jgi:glyoxylase-like metal-dependent hydrolase (beta-lactamase superfamily II)
MPVVGWTEVGADCFAHRYKPFDVTVGAVVGASGVVVVDTRASLVEAAELRADLGRLTTRPVCWVVNTHWHFDHCFGNAEFADDRIELWAHPTVPGMLAEHAEEVVSWLRGQGSEWAAAMDALHLAPPTRGVPETVTLDLGDRIVELIHPGRGHTDGDVVVRVPDADVVYAGDLVEESGPPAYGDDSFPLDWPSTLGRVLDLVGPRTAVVPGHGAAVDQAFVAAQQAQIAAVARAIEQLAAAAVEPDDALAATRWPFPADGLADAVRRGFAQLRSAWLAARPARAGCPG